MWKLLITRAEAKSYWFVGNKLSDATSAFAAHHPFIYTDVYLEIMMKKYNVVSVIISHKDKLNKENVLCHKE